MPPGPLQRHSLTLDGSLAAAGEASIWARTLASQAGIAAERVADLDLCVVELINNIVEHGYRGEPGEIFVELVLDGESVVLAVADDAPSFDPTRVPPMQAPRSLEEAPIGGRGLHLVRSSADACSYERRAGRNVFTAYFGAAGALPRLHERRSDGAASFPLARANGDVVERDERSGADRRALGFISQCGLFRDVAYAELEGLVARCRLVRLDAGHTILQPGTKSPSVFVIVAGSLRVHLGEAGSDDYFDLPRGGCVGEISVADGKPASAWVVTAEPCLLLEIGADVFLGELLAIPRIGRNVIRQLAERMRRSNERIVERMRSAAELRALQQELDFARQIQSNMLPAAPLLPGHDDVTCYGYMRAARQVGGDFYDAIRQGPWRSFVAIGDVCNKGMPAALFMARALTILRGVAADFVRDPEGQLARIARTCNDQLALANEAQLFVSMLLAIVDAESGRLHYCSVGHCPPLLLRPGESPAFLEGPRNPVAGVVPDLDYRAATLDFPRGSILLLYTDGITEAEAPDGGQFGEGRVLRALEYGAEDIVSCGERLVAAVDEFAAGRPQSDDITLLLLRRT